MENRIVKGFLWSFAEKFGSVFLAFLFNWALARFFLSPSDFGIIGMMNFFIVLANTTVIGGFGQALIQKKEPNMEDYSTVFYCNLLMAFVLYYVLWFLAPHISSFYSMDLTIYIRIFSISLLLNSTIIVQRNILAKQMNFKKISIIYNTSSIIGYFIGVWIAINGGGVWSLILSTLIILLIQSILYWICSSWRPMRKFSKKSFQSLFSYGFFMLLSNIVETIYENITYLVMGRFYNSSVVGFYTQADKLQKVPIHTFSMAIDQVVFPWFAGLQDNLLELRSKFIICFKVTAYVSFVIITLLILTGDEIILILFTDKWMNSIPIFKILCAVGAFYIIDVLNENTLKSLGKSKLYFVIRLVKRLTVVLALIFSIQYGIDRFLLILLALSILSYIFGAIVTSVVLEYKLIDQLLVLTKYIVMVLVAYISVVFINDSLDIASLFWRLSLKVILYITIILIVSYIFRMHHLVMILLKKNKK